MTEAGKTQDNFILPAPPVGLPISQDRLDRMKLVRDRTIPVILPSEKDILFDTMFKIIIGYTNLGTRYRPYLEIIFAALTCHPRIFQILRDALGGGGGGGVWGLLSPNVT